jgi:hypothetical protein
MRVILNVAVNEINHELIELIKILVSRNAEIVIRKEIVMLEEYDQNLSLEKVMQELSSQNYHPDFLADLEKGLKNSSIYAK